MTIRVLNRDRQLWKLFLLLRFRASVFFILAADFRLAEQKHMQHLDIQGVSGRMIMPFL